MRTYGALFTPIPQPPDTVQTLLMTGGSSAQASDWVVSTGAAASARAAGAQIVLFSGQTSGNLGLAFSVNLVSTHANVASSGSSVTTGTTAGSTGNSIMVLGSRAFQIPAWSTGWSVAAMTSGWITAEVWKK